VALIATPKPAEMTIDELLAVTGEPGCARQQVDPAIAEDGRLIVITGVVAGFGAERLTFLETIPVKAG
jgi:hypothetical protein